MEDSNSESLSKEIIELNKSLGDTNKKIEYLHELILEIGVDLGSKHSEFKLERLLREKQIIESKSRDWESILNAFMEKAFPDRTDWLLFEELGPDSDDKWSFNFNERGKETVHCFSSLYSRKEARSVAVMNQSKRILEKPSRLYLEPDEVSEVLERIKTI